jgi:glycosyltransferase involved in cell wall biosynthesis
MRQIKVFYDSQIFCSQVYGGVSRYFCELATHLSVSNLNMLVKIIAPFYVNEYLKQTPKYLIEGFAAPQFVKTGVGTFASYARSCVRLLSILLGALCINIANPHIVHQTYFYPLCIFRKRTKRIMTIYDMIHEKFASNFPVDDKTAKYKRRAAMSADHIICISESTRRDVIEILGVDPQKTSVVYLGFNYFSQSNEMPGELIGFSEAPYLLYVGQRSGYKNFEKFLLAYSESKKLRETFNIICFGGGAFTDGEKDFIKKLEISDKKILHYSGNDQLLGFFYKNARAFVYPSQYEGFGIPPLEAMSLGCPVICSFASSIPEVVGNAAELFDPNDILAIRNAIENVVFDEKRTLELISLGKNQLSKFSWEKCAQETKKIYEKLY